MTRRPIILTLESAVDLAICGLEVVNDLLVSRRSEELAVESCRLIEQVYFTCRIIRHGGKGDDGSQYLLYIL